MRTLSSAPHTSKVAAGVLGSAAISATVVAARVASGRPILAARWSLLVLLTVWAALWATCVVAAFRAPRRTAVAVIIAAAVALRLAALAGPPTTSDDLYRYAWDGRVQAAGVDPYAAAPGAPALASFREGWLWPDAKGCSALHRPVGCTRINRPSVPTIYPPVAEAWFGAVYRIAGIRARHKSWQVAGLATDLATVALLGVALRRWRRDVRWMSLYALSPAPVLEIVNNAHVDGLAVLLMVAALVVAAPHADDRARTSPSHDVLAGVLLGAAALVKLYPAIIVGALVAARPASRRAALARTAGAAAAVAVPAYAPHVRHVGVKVLGYLPGYLKEEHYRQGTRYLLAAALHIPVVAAGPLTALSLVVVAGWTWRRPQTPPLGATLILGVALLGASPVQPWYAVALLAVATVSERPGWAAVAAAGYPYFFAVVLADRHAAGIGEISYATALAVAIGWTAVTRFRNPSRRDGSAASTPLVEHHTRRAGPPCLT